MNTANDTTPNTMLDLKAMIIMLTGFILFFFIYQFVYQRLRRFAQKTSNTWDDFVVELFRYPLLGFFIWIMIKLFTLVFLHDLAIFQYLSHINAILLIISIAWILMKGVKLGVYLLERKIDIRISNNLQARKNLTQIKVFKSISNAIIGIVAFALILMTFDQAKEIGKSLLTSAGIISVIVGFAAQKSIGMFLAGIQIAITQPIRLDDVVIVEGEWGKIEEISLTYVVVQIWDSRRLVLPITYFLETPFQNWTKTSADIMGTVFFYVGFDFPVQALRDFLPEILKNNANWDGKVVNVQVTNANERFKELRVLVSSTDASRNWDLRVEVREKVIDFIQKNYPHCFVKIQIKNDTPNPGQTVGETFQNPIF
ncbi:mechanosensitive ion channel family protein [Microbacter margulisiae]|uniref:Small-conductance mechanosensitive channel n=1 Tax=Microbacter margulisiae TaxID=1350067 RepID=A0A7W5DPE7_9PORP|nr:mechanosensitive ion channel domain-containing protein [Microbacter margulisiae]MBB3186596.1 small-conductance mechanosensitive channel [Microbacter margulisiae]